MTNGEKYKTAKERSEAFSHDNEITEADEILNVRQLFNWLDLEAEEEKPLPCPFCGGETQLTITKDSYERYYVSCSICEYETGHCYRNAIEAITEHNLLAKNMVMVKEQKQENEQGKVKW